MCELPSLRKAKHYGKYSFDNVFYGAQSAFEKTDYLVGNLETVFAGEKRRYSHDIYSYNTPDTFANALKKAGFNLVSTANNHCLDRGIDGLYRTLDVLDECGIKHTGTYRLNSNNDNLSVVNIHGIKFGFLAYTYGSNYAINRIRLNEEECSSVNYFTPQNWYVVRRRGVYNFIKDNCFRRETRVELLKKLGKQYNVARTDNMELGELNCQVYSDIKRIKNECDYVVVLMHSGGQFNEFPGQYTSQLVEKLLDFGVDFIIGNHPHIVQRIYRENCKIVAYSLGNFYISPDTIYLLNELLPLYSIVLHIDISRSGDINTSFSILTTLNRNGKEFVVDTYDLFNKLTDEKMRKKTWTDCKQVYKQVTGIKAENFFVQKEYSI